MTKYGPETLNAKLNPEPLNPKLITAHDFAQAPWEALFCRTNCLTALPTGTGNNCSNTHFVVRIELDINGSSCAYTDSLAKVYEAGSLARSNFLSSQLLQQTAANF